MQLKNWEKQRKPDEISKNELGNYSKENKELECQQTIKPMADSLKKKVIK